MSRQMWCGECAQAKQPGTRIVLPESEEGEPAEFERVVKGKAKVANQDQQTVYINQAPMPTGAQNFICDNCNRDILPFEDCMAWTVWSSEMEEPPEWESDYIVVDA